MSQTRKFVVWDWWDDDGSVKFVGWGCMGRSHPAKELWARRRGAASDLNFWLRSRNVEPIRIDRGGLTNYYRGEASSVARALRDKYVAEGHVLLDSRPWGSRDGGGAARMVMSPDMAVYNSVRQAAVDQGVNPCTITRWCQAAESGWEYIS